MAVPSAFCGLGWSTPGAFWEGYQPGTKGGPRANLPAVRRDWEAVSGLHTLPPMAAVPQEMDSEWGLSQGCRGSWGEAASTATGCGRWCWAAGRGRVAGSRGAGPVREEGQEAAKAPERQQLIPRHPVLLPRVHRRPPAGGTLLQDPLPAPTSLLTALSSQLRGPHPEPDPHPPPLSASVGSTGATRGASAGLLRATCSAAFEARPALERAQGGGGGGL